MRRPYWKAAVLCAGLFACSNGGSDTEMAVVVWSDLIVPADIDSVQVFVKGKADTVRRSFPLAPTIESGTGRELARFSLVPSDPNEPAFELKVVGRLENVDVVQQVVSSRCISGQRKLLKLLLSRECKDSTCGPGLPCWCGSCRAVAVSPETLPAYESEALTTPPTCQSTTGADAGIDRGTAYDADSTTVIDSSADMADSLSSDMAVGDVEMSEARDVPIGSGETSGIDGPSGTGASSGRGGATGRGGAGGATGTGGAAVGTGGSGTGGTRAGGAGTGGTGVGGMGGAGGASTTAVVQCGPLSDPADGSVSVTTRTPGSSADYSCSSGFNLNGNARLTCQANGSWSASAPTCSPVDCGGLPDPTHGKVSTSPSTTFGSKATYTCSEHYAPLGDLPPRTCQANGKWDGEAPTCEVNCGPPQTPSHGGISLPSGTWVNSLGDYYCCADLQLTPSTSTTKCQEDGSWSLSPAPACLCLNNPTPGWGETCTYTADAGVEATGMKGCMGACWPVGVECLTGAVR